MLVKLLNSMHSLSADKQEKKFSVWKPLINVHQKLYILKFLKIKVRNFKHSLIIK